MACPTENTLVEFIHLGLAPEARRQLNGHLAECEACRAIVAVVAEQDSKLGASPAALVKTVTGAAAASPPLEADLAPGERVGRYVVSRRVGAGGMGVVYAAHDPDLDRPVALKMLRWQAVGADEQHARDARGRLLREAQSMARLSHPNVVTVYDVGTHGAQIFVAMEYVEGVTLTQWLRPDRTVRECLEVFGQAGLGLAAAHAAGLVHRDFKPSNVMVSADGRVRVTDFGLARAASAEEERAAREASAGTLVVDPLSHTRTGVVLGTPAYMAPEQFAGTAVDQRSDQFSFCVALYEALYRERPFAGVSLGEVQTAITAGVVRPPPRASQVPAAVRVALLRGLQANGSERFPTIDALLEALRSPQPRRLGRVRALAGGALAVSGVLAALLFWPRAPGDPAAPVAALAGARQPSARPDEATRAASTEASGVVGVPPRGPSERGQQGKASPAEASVPRRRAGDEEPSGIAPRGAEEQGEASVLRGRGAPGAAPRGAEEQGEPAAALRGRGTGDEPTPAGTSEAVAGPLRGPGARHDELTRSAPAEVHADGHGRAPSPQTGATPTTAAPPTSAGRTSSVSASASAPSARRASEASSDPSASAFSEASSGSNSGKPTGFIAVHISPWGTLAVDGHPAESANSMDYVIAVARGRHQLLATHPQFGQRAAVVTVEGGKTAQWNFELH